MPARVTYALRGGGTRTTTARWPVLVTHTRIVPDDFDEPDEIAIPWRMDVVTLPAVSYRVAPSILLAALLGVAALLALAGGVFLYRALPRRAPAQPVRVEERPEPPLTPLERALALLEDAERADGSADRRRALRLVADALHERDAELARAARALAWSVETPEVGATSGLAGRMRDVLARDREAEDA